MSVGFALILASLVAAVPVNDIHSQLNLTRVAEVRRPTTAVEVQAIVRDAAKRHMAISVAGGRHAMGGQQFGEGTILVDMSSMRRILGLDVARRLANVEAGIQWPELIVGLMDRQPGVPEGKNQLSIRQKQTGADRLSIGGALAANVHGRGLTFKPFIDDVESFRLVDPEGDLKTCSRQENADLFGLVIGGYGLFGIVVDVQLRLYPRIKLQRVVEITDVDTIDAKVAQRVSQGHIYGDLQYSIDGNSSDFLRRGVFSTYQALPDNTPMPPTQKELRERDWINLYWLAHTDKPRAFEIYSQYYLSTQGQRYWSDIHQLGVYVDHYHRDLDARLRQARPDYRPGTEMISELYVPRAKLGAFMQKAAAVLKENHGDVIYGTVRFIEKDDESFLAWAKDNYAAVIFNLHVEHSTDGLARAAGQFRDLIDAAESFGGSFYLTYQAWASRDQVERAYPQMPRFLAEKRRLDPNLRFQSEWYRHMSRLFARPVGGRGEAGGATVGSVK